MGASATISSVMPVSSVIFGGMGFSGIHKGVEGVHDFAARHLHRADLSDPLVVGR